MRSEDDIRDALEALANTAPDADQVLARVQAKERGERRSAFHAPVLVGLSVIATAAAMVAVPLSLKLPGQDVPVASAPVTGNPKWQLKFSVDAPAGYRVRSWAITPDYQAATVVAPAATSCEVMVFEPNVFDIRQVPAVGGAEEINEAVGYTSVFDDPRSSVPGPLPRLMWKSSPASWATTACRTRFGKPDLRSQVVVARAVTDTPSRTSLPFRIRYLPAGVAVHSVGAATGPAVALATTMAARYAAGGGPVAGSTGRRTDLVMELRPVSRPPAASPLTIGGRPARVTVPVGAGSVGQAQLAVNLGSYEVALSSASKTSPVPLAELTKVAENMEFAPNLDDESTWFDATVAIP